MLTVHWSEPPCGTKSGVIASYSYSLTNNGRVVNRGITSSLDVTIENLVPFTSYEFTVLAVNPVGEGPWSEELIISTNEAGKLWLYSETSTTQLIFRSY